MTDITIISGFLGSGKTTLIKKLLTGPLSGTDTAIIENDYGDINIDGEFLKETGVQMREIMAGCICCTLAGDFSRALTELKTAFSPGRILIEPSGIGKLSDVIRAVRGVTDDPANDMRLSGTLTVVDVTIFDMIYETFGEFYRDQIEAAGTIYMSHLDDDEADEDMIRAALKGIRQLNKEAAIITTPVDELGADALLKAIEGKVGRLNEFVRISLGGMTGRGGKAFPGNRLKGFRLPAGFDPNGEDEALPSSAVFLTWSGETLRRFEEDEILLILKDMQAGRFGTILRAKGLTASSNGWIHFDLTVGHIDVRKGTPGTIGQICVIGTDFDPDELEDLFVN